MPYKKIVGIYKIKNLKNNKIYIGSSVSINSRFSTHKNLLKNNKHWNKHLQSSYNKYGIENFSFEIIEIFEYINKNEIKEREEFNIKFYSSNIKEYGYNKRDICNTNLGIKFSEEHIEKLRKSHIGNKRSSEAHKKIIESQYKKVYQINSKFEIINMYNSIKEASEKSGVNKQSISMCCRELMNSGGGFYWCLVDKYSKDKIFKKNKNFPKTRKKYFYKNLSNNEIFLSLKTVSKFLNIENYILNKMFIGKIENNTNFIRYENNA